MRFAHTLPLLLASSALAYPGLESLRDDIVANVKKEGRAAANDPLGLAGLTSNLLGSLGKTLAGLPESLAQNINPNNKRPEEGYDFREPGPNDSRGPCPGLNLLANHGYLPRNGYVNLGQVNEATSRGFNMHYDLSTVLGVFAILANGNLTEQSWYLGAGANGIGGLNRHSTVEADISPNREDYYNGCGDNHHLSSRLVKQLIHLMSQSREKTVSFDVMTQHYATQAQFAKDNNPYLYYFPFPLIVSLGAYAFYPNFFSNGTYGAGGVPNWESIASIIGAKYDAATDQVMYVPERFPENWYRRDTPYGAVDTIVDGLKIFAANPIVPPGGGLLTQQGLTPQSLLCLVYQGLDSITPLDATGAATDAQGAVSWAVSVLDKAFDRTVLGCPGDAISKSPTDFLYPNATGPGGPRGRTPAQNKWEQNNVYHKVYFKEAPVQPACAH